MPLPQPTLSFKLLQSQLFRREFSTDATFSWSSLSRNGKSMNGNRLSIPNSCCHHSANIVFFCVNVFGVRSSDYNLELPSKWCGCKEDVLFSLFLFLPWVSNFYRPCCFPVSETDRHWLWYLGGKISEWERWTLSGNQFLSGQPLSAACRSICISDISAFVFLRSFHLYFFKLFLSICSTQLLWHSIPFLIVFILNSLNFCKTSKVWIIWSKAILWYLVTLK